MRLLGEKLFFLMKGKQESLKYFLGILLVIPKTHFPKHPYVGLYIFASLGGHARESNGAGALLFSDNSMMTLVMLEQMKSMNHKILGELIFTCV